MHILIKARYMLHALVYSIQSLCDASKIGFPLGVLQDTYTRLRSEVVIRFKGVRMRRFALFLGKDNKIALSMIKGCQPSAASVAFVTVEYETAISDPFNF